MLISSVVSSVAKWGSYNIEDAVAVADREIQDLRDEIEEFRRVYDDVLSTSDEDFSYDKKNFDCRNTTYRQETTGPYVPSGDNSCEGLLI